MLDELKISLKRPRGERSFELSDREEAATLGLLVIKASSRVLTLGYNKHIRKWREGPLVSAYPMAEWFAWNWWRLTCETGGRPSSLHAACKWDFSHCLSTIGSGYDWPNISIYSDECRSYLTSKQSMPDSTSSFEYHDSSRVTVSTKALERAICDFIDTTISMLEDKGIRDSNLQRLWCDLTSERTNSGDARYRTMEAKLGFDPDVLSEKTVKKFLATQS